MQLHSDFYRKYRISVKKKNMMHFYTQKQITPKHSCSGVPFFMFDTVDTTPVRVNTTRKHESTDNSCTRSMYKQTILNYWYHTVFKCIIFCVIFNVPQIFVCADFLSLSVSKNALLNCPYEFKECLNAFLRKIKKNPYQWHSYKSHVAGISIPLAL